MSEQIYIEGNTYTLGATVGPVSGTGGSTSYFFGNLSGGQTYYFVVVSYNYSGFSGYAGPIAVYTPPEEESRPLIYLYAWDWPHISGSDNQRIWGSGSTGNLVTSSSNIKETNYNWTGQGTNTSRISENITDPFSGTGAFAINSVTTLNEYVAWRTSSYNLESGNTYIFSFWLNVTTGATLANFRLINLTSSNTGPASFAMAMNQVLPPPTSARGPSIEQTIQYPESASFSGWQRFGYEFYLGQTQEHVSCYMISENNKSGGSTWYVYGPQLIKGTTTTNYVSTSFGCASSDLLVTKYYYNDSNTELQYTVGNSAWLAFGDSYGISYSIGLVNPFSNSVFEPPYTQNVGQSNWSRKQFEKLKALPIRKRAIQPNFLNTNYHILFDDDKLSFSGGSSRSYLNDDSNLSYTSPISNYYPNPWPVTGISAMQKVWGEMVDYMKSSGVTLDFVFMDKEGTFFDLDFVANNASIANSLISGNAKYNQSWYGITSWKDIYEGVGGVTSGPASYNYSYSPKPYFLGWHYAAQTYDAKNLDIAFTNKLISEYPDITVSNYDDYITDPGMCGGPHDMNGHPLPRGAYVGNASSPVLYGYLKVLVQDFVSDYSKVWSINGSDPTTLEYFGSGASLTIGPWTSFLQAMGEVRSAKRNALNIPLTPWIGPVSWSMERQDLLPVVWSGPDISPQEVRDKIQELGLCGTKGGTANFWHKGPRIGFADSSTGYNSKEHVYYTEVSGNSAYYFEFVRHVLLHGTKGIGLFNPTTFIDYGVTGVCLATLDINNSNFSQSLIKTYFMSGSTAHVNELKQLDDTVQDTLDKIGGFTLTTADYSKIPWNAEWVASGAPGLNGSTWWWRITGNPNYIVTVDGNTVLSATGPGMWLGTTGPTLGVSISSSPVLAPL